MTQDVRMPRWQLELMLADRDPRVQPEAAEPGGQGRHTDVSVCLPGDTGLGTEPLCFCPRGVTEEALSRRRSLLSLLCEARLPLKGRSVSFLLGIRWLCGRRCGFCDLRNSRLMSSSVVLEEPVAKKYFRSSGACVSLLRRPPRPGRAF